MSSNPPPPLWHVAGFRNLWIAQTVSALGSRVSRTAIPVIAVLSLHGTAFQLGLLSALTVLPGAALGLALGGRIDRTRKRPILVAADLVRAVAVVTVPIAAWAGVLSMAQLFVVVAVAGSATVLFRITDNAFLPTLIGTRRLVEGNAKLEATDSVAEIAGPGLAGILIELLTAPLTMLLDAASYLVSAAFLGRIRVTETPAAPHAEDGVVRDAVLGARVCWREPLVRPLLLSSAIATLSGGFFFALYMLYTLDVLGLSAGVVGVVIGVGGVGALGGAFVAPRLSRALGLGPAMVVSCALGQLAALAIPLAQGSRAATVGWLLVHQLFGDGFLVAFAIHAVSLRQAVVPRGLLARTNAVFAVVEGALLPVGALSAGALGTALGVRSAVWVGVVGGLAAPLLLSPLWRLRRLPREPGVDAELPP
jgi:hypothetical protein